VASTAEAEDDAKAGAGKSPPLIAYSRTTLAKPFTSQIEPANQTVAKNGKKLNCHVTG
jgi:hypothetical protein